MAAARRHDGGPVVWAGSADLADEVTGYFEPGAVSSVANSRPDARREEAGPLRERLAELVREVSGPEADVHLASVAFPRAIGTLAAAAGMRILGIDLGARSATRASPSRMARLRAGAMPAAAWPARSSGLVRPGG